jgi:hypothetical protein
VLGVAPVFVPPGGLADALGAAEPEPTVAFPLGVVLGVVVSGVSLSELPQAIRVVQMRA